MTLAILLAMTLLGLVAILSGIALLTFRRLIATVITHLEPPPTSGASTAEQAPPWPNGAPEPRPAMNGGWDRVDDTTLLPLSRQLSPPPPRHHQVGQSPLDEDDVPTALYHTDEDDECGPALIADDD